MADGAADGGALTSSARIVFGGVIIHSSVFCVLQPAPLRKHLQLSGAVARNYNLGAAACANRVPSTGS